MCPAVAICRGGEANLKNIARHCEERSNKAISNEKRQYSEEIASLIAFARNDWLLTRDDRMSTVFARHDRGKFNVSLIS